MTRTPEQKAKHAAKERARRAANPERHKEAVRRSAALHRERYLALRRQWYADNGSVNLRREKAKAQRLKWKKANPDKILAYQRKRRAKLKQARNFPAMGELLKAKLCLDPLYAAAKSAVPLSYPPHVRDDMISSIVLAVLEGEFTQCDIPTHAKRFVSKYWRDRDLFGTLSLNASIPGYDGITYMDRLNSLDGIG